MGRKGSETVQLRVNIMPWMDKGLEKLSNELGVTKTYIVNKFMEQGLERHGITSGIGTDKPAEPAGSLPDKTPFSKTA